MATIIISYHRLCKKGAVSVSLAIWAVFGLSLDKATMRVFVKQRMKGNGIILC